MKGDFSRDSFDRQRPFSRVMMQQGRVSLDADWNEQSALTLAGSRRLAADLLGRGAGPDGCCGFGIATGAHAHEIGDSPKTHEAALRKGDLLILPGLYYVGGIAVELGAAMLYSAQPGYPFDDATRIGSLEAAGNWLAYLDVWEEFVAADQDEALRDPALGGVDSNGRALVRWQVRILPSPRKGVESFEAFASRASGRLTAWTGAGKAAGSLVPPGGGFRGAENRLYRVEVHRGSDAAGKGATFKWSRDNGAFIYPVHRLDGCHVGLGHLGDDGRSELSAGDWVELVDDSWAGRNPGGPLGRIAQVKPGELSVIVEWAGAIPTLPATPAGLRALRPVLRRWDHQGVGTAGGAIPVSAGKELELEDGIFIAFEPGSHYRPGDYWLIPARPGVPGGILWPGAPEAPAARSPDGPEHKYAPLALYKDGRLVDLRHRFKPISEPVAGRSENRS